MSFARAMLDSFDEKRLGKYGGVRNNRRPPDHFEYKRGSCDFTEALIAGYLALCAERGIEPWPHGDPWMT